MKRKSHCNDDSSSESDSLIGAKDTNMIPRCQYLADITSEHIVSCREKIMENSDRLEKIVDQSKDLMQEAKQLKKKGKERKQYEILNAYLWTFILVAVILVIMVAILIPFVKSFLPKSFFESKTVFSKKKSHLPPRSVMTPEIHPHYSNKVHWSIPQMNWYKSHPRRPHRHPIKEIEVSGMWKKWTPLQKSFKSANKPDGGNRDDQTQIRRWTKDKRTEIRILPGHLSNPQFNLQQRNSDVETVKDTQVKKRNEALSKPVSDRQQAAQTFHLRGLFSFDRKGGSPILPKLNISKHVPSLYDPSSALHSRKQSPRKIEASSLLNIHGDRLQKRYLLTIPPLHNSLRKMRRDTRKTALMKWIDTRTQNIHFMTDKAREIIKRWQDSSRDRTVDLSKSLPRKKVILTQRFNFISKNDESSGVERDLVEDLPDEEKSEPLLSQDYTAPQANSAQRPEDVHANNGKETPKDFRKHGEDNKTGKRRSGYQSIILRYETMLEGMNNKRPKMDR